MTPETAHRPTEPPNWAGATAGENGDGSAGPPGVLRKDREPSRRDRPERDLLDKDPRLVAVLSLALFALLGGIYLLSYSGIYHSSDEVGYVRDAVEVLREGPAELGHGGPFSLALAIGLALAQAGTLIRPLQGLFLVNIMASALAAVFLFLTIVELDYDRRAALLVALLYGLASPAWVYSKLLFRDPFVAMSLIAMVAFLVRFRRRSSYPALGLAILFCALAVTTRPSTAIVAPFAFAYVAQALLSSSKRTLTRSTTKTVLAILVVLLLLAAVGFAVLKVFNLYTKWLDRLLRFFEHWDAIAGLLISPGRGALFYVPIVLVALVGLVRFARRHPWETVLAYGPIPFYLLMVSSHPMWWGGWNWGPRYLVPVMPMLLLPMISVVEPLVVKPSLRWAAVLLAGLALISFLTQLVGATIGTNSPAFETMEVAAFFRWSNAPFYQLTLLDKISPDLAWLHLTGGLPDLALVVAPTVIVTLLSAGVLWLAATRPAATPGMLAAALAATLLLLGVAVWSVYWYSGHDSRYKSPAGFQAAIERVAADSQPGDLLIYDHWKTDELDHIFPSLVSNFCGDQCPPVEEVVLDYWGPSEQLPRLVEHVKWLDKIRWTYQRVWLVPSAIAPSDQNAEVQPWLDAYLFKAGCEQFSPETGLCLYYVLTPRDDLAPAALAPQLSPARAVLFLPLVVAADSPKANPRAVGPSAARIGIDAMFGDRLRLDEMRLYWQSPSSQLPGEPVMTSPGKPLLVELLWQTLDKVDTRYKVSLQLLDSQGTLVHQLDREPLDGFLPITGWPPHQLRSDRYAIVMPADLPPGAYQLTLAVYNPQDGARLPAEAGDSLKLADVAIVAPP